MADLRRKIMVIDGIKVITQPCVFLAINSAPSPVSNPLAFSEPRPPHEQPARSDNQHMLSLLSGRELGRWRLRTDTLRDQVLKNTLQTNKSEKKTPLKS